MMYYVDMPSAEEIGDLNLVRSDACISIYLPTTPVSRDTEQSRIHLGNLVKKAIAQLEAAGLDKRRVLLLQEQFADLLDDDDFWSHQANSLAILATPESLRTYRMANTRIIFIGGLAASSSCISWQIWNINLERRQI